MRKKAAQAAPDPVPASLTVEDIPIEQITEYPSNSRMHTVEQIELLAKAIAEFGFTNPILIDANNEIIAGHARKSAAERLDMKTVPCIRLGHLTPEQKRALVIADNKIAITGTQWDYTLLKVELAELKLADFNLELTGFGEAEIDQLFAPPTDTAAEWTGMPEFVQPDKMAFHTVAVHFKDQEGVDAFAQLIQQKITDTTRFVWFPLVEREVNKDRRYSSEP